MENRWIPQSAATGITWPAIPGARNATLLALQYQFDQTQRWPVQEIENLQLHQLSDLLAHAYRFVPFQRDRLKSMVGQGFTLSSYEDLRKIPIIRRQDIQEHFQQMKSTSIPEDHLPIIKGSTSGSTGMPVTYLNTRVTQVFARAMLLRSHCWHGQDLNATVASIQFPRGNWAAADEHTGRRFNNTFPSGTAYRLDSRKTISEQLSWLQSNGAQWIITQPSNLAALATEANDKGISLPGLKHLSTLGEVLSPYVRKLCQEVWGLTVTDTYSCKETNVLAIQCPENEHYHVQSERVIVEILDENDRPCKPGEVGRVVVTDLHNYAMPFIRYEIGDFAMVGEACSCGRTLPVLKQILGRVRNMLVLPSGERQWPSVYYSQIASIAPIRQMQIIQHSLADIEVKLVVTRTVEAATELKLLEALESGLGEGFKVRLSYVDSIPRSAGGKFEDFMSKL